MKTVKYKKNRKKWCVFEDGKIIAKFSNEKEAVAFAAPKPVLIPYEDYLPPLE